MDECAYRLIERRLAKHEHALSTSRRSRPYDRSEFFLGRDNKRWKNLGPSSLYESAPSRKKISHTCAKLLSSFPQSPSSASSSPRRLCISLQTLGLRQVGRVVATLSREAISAASLGWTSRGSAISKNSGSTRLAILESGLRGADLLCDYIRPRKERHAATAKASP